MPWFMIAEIDQGDTRAVLMFYSLAKERTINMVCAMTFNRVVCQQLPFRYPNKHLGVRARDYLLLGPGLTRLDMSVILAMVRILRKIAGGGNGGGGGRRGCSSGGGGG